MWPLDRKSKNKDEKIKKAFGQYIPANIIDNLMSADNVSFELIEKEIDYAFILVSESSIESVPQIIKAVLDIAEKHEGMVESITGPLIIVLLGIPQPQDNAQKRRHALVVDLHESLGASISIVHGNTKCLVGTVGNKNRSTITALIPNYKEKLKLLSNMEYGQQLEIK